MKNLIRFAICLIIAGTFFNCSSDDIAEASCNTVLLGIDAAITGGMMICMGESATLSINGAPTSEVTYTANGQNATVVTLNADGNVTIEVSPAETTEYNLTNIKFENCEKSIESGTVVSVK